MAPVIKALQAHPNMNSVVCLTAQHREMLDQVLQIFAIKADFDLDLMQPSQTAAMPVTNCTPRSSAWDDGKSDHQMIRRRQRIRSPVCAAGLSSALSPGSGDVAGGRKISR